MKTNLQQQNKEKLIDKQNITEKAPSSTERIQGLDLEDKSEIERREAYIEPKTRNLLRELIQCEDQLEIIPRYDPSLGFVYQSSEQKLDKTSENLPLEFLENLVRLDILKKSFYDSVALCPSCHSTILTLHNRCPKCKSHNIDKTSLTEHIPCGFIDQRNKYINNLCPKCGERLIEGQFRNMGRWFVCRDCNERFEDPEYDVTCRSCNKSVTIKEAQLTEIPKFSLNQNRKKEIRQNVASLESVKALLIDLGFSVDMPGLVLGEKSKIEHHFSLTARKQVKGVDMLIALDHAVSETEVSSSPLILYIYKTSEVKVDIPIFVAMPQLNETAKKIAQGHEILVVEGSIDEKDAIEKIKSDIESRIEMKLIEYEVKGKMKDRKSSFAEKFGKLTGFNKN